MTDDKIKYLVDDEPKTPKPTTLEEIKRLIRKHNISPEYAALSVYISTYGNLVDFEKLLSFFRD